MRVQVLIELLLGVAAFLSTGVGTYVRLLAQAEVNPNLDITGIVTQFGGLGFAIWLVWYHTTKTIPEMQKEHKAERETSQRAWEAVIERGRIEFMKESETQRAAFEKNLERIACKANLPQFKQ